MILLVSDGFSSELRGENDLTIAKQMQESNIIVYAVHFADSSIPDEIVNITSVTGGEVFTVEALLRAAPQLASQWHESVNLLAGNWLREAVVSYQFDQSTRRGPSLRRDPFGNYFYSDGDTQYRSMPRNSNRIKAIKTGDLLEIKPSEEWLALVSEGVKPKVDAIFAQLYLKVNEEDHPFPHI
jgi:hypothetical protein